MKKQTFTERFAQYPGDGDSWGTFDFYDDFEALLTEALASGEPFETPWMGVKKEIESFRISRDDSGAFVCEVSVSDDFDTEGNGWVERPIGSDLDALREGLREAAELAEENRRENECYVGFSICRESNGGWVHTLILPMGMGHYMDEPPGDNYYEWGFQEDENDPLTEEEREAIMAQVDNLPEGEFVVGRWRVKPWNKD